ncbi:class I SAM-dependent methyltransferase [Streptomyces sp. ST2-7A]|uniref:class I SAM-dependent methyltransferase n=1 Tax=Streptomyces sp. ST2-7A TaxID=2907214 RepID=UPI001F336241|nr:class I SAM-dependent methyltransferase [Streptomyces sp. ST2-7A]MCE7079613.1 class I SAM-dependent methyltransferase [Streptomyces sp. ST2-7A]
MTTTDRADLFTYLARNRDFFAPVVEQAVATLDPGDRGRILDMGTGGGGGLVALARAAGPGTRVLGVDRSADVLELARRHAEENDVASRVDTREADLMDVLTEASAGDPFDAVWASDVVWPGNVDDPAATVALIAGALTPGGVAGLFTSNYYQAMFLPGHSRLERLLRAASESAWGIPDEGPTHYERHVHWMVAAGLRDVRLRVLPRVGFPIDGDPTVRPYLEDVVWPEFLAAARLKGAEAGMDGKDIERARALLTPGSGEYVLDDPGHYVVVPALLVTGRN